MAPPGYQKELDRMLISVESADFDRTYVAALEFTWIQTKNDVGGMYEEEMALIGAETLQKLNKKSSRRT